MAAPLIVRLLMDAGQYLKTVDTAVSSNTKLDESIIGVGQSASISADKQVAASLKASKALEAQIAGYRTLAADSTATAETQVRASLLADRAQQRFNAQMGISAVATGEASAAARTGERDFGKLTRGVLAGSGAASSLGRSLAFASTGFIAVAGGATLLASSIKASISLAATQRQVQAQLATSGKTWTQYGAAIDNADLKLSHLSGFTNQELLQGFGYLVRENDNVTQSLHLTAVAADVARGRNISLASAAIALAKAQGGSLTALRRLGIIVPKNLNDMQALEFVTRKFAGQAESGATVTDHFHASLVNTEETIGNAVLPTFTRLVTELGNWLDKMNQTGRSQSLLKEGLHDVGIGASVVKDAFKILDTVTGSLNNTLRILFAIFLGREAVKAITTINSIAASWGLVATAANGAAAAEERAAIAGGGAGAAGAAGGIAGTVGKVGAGAFLGSAFKRLIGRGGTSGARFAVGSDGIATDLGAGEVGAAAGLSATGVGTLAVAAVIAAGALNDFAKNINAKFGGGSTFNKVSDALTGFLTGGLAGNKNDSPLHAIGFLFRSQRAAEQNAFGGPSPRLSSTFGSLPPFLSPKRVSTPSILDTANKTLAWAKYSQTLYEQLQTAQAALTKSTSDDVKVAKAIIARIKRLIAEGHLTGANLVAALQDEATQQSVINNARQAAAQQAAKIAAAKQAAASSYTTPIDLQIAEVRAQLTASSADDLQVERQILAAAKAAAASAGKNKQGQLAALQVELQAQQAIQSLGTQNSSTFTQSLKLQLALAKAQALGTDQTGILLRMKAALEKALKAAKGNIQKQIDIFNQIAAINSQLGSSAASALGDFKQLKLNKIAQSLHLTAEQAKKLRSELSQVGPHGTVPRKGTGAFGFIIGKDGRPIHLHNNPSNGRDVAGGGGGNAPRVLHASFNIKVELDGRDITRSVTISQQRTRGRNSSQRRGPNAGWDG